MMTPMEEQNNNDSHGPRDSRPDPDPTRLTTQLLTREIAALKEIIMTRLEAMDKAILVANANIVQARSETRGRIGSLRELMQKTFDVHLEKFTTVQTQFEGRDTALTAALQAAKEAVGEQNKSFGESIAKSEAATTKQIDQQAILIDRGTQGLKDSMDDVKTRLDRIEGQNLGSVAARTTQQTSNTGTIAIIAVGATVLGLVLAFVMALLGKQ